MNQDSNYQLEELEEVAVEESISTGETCFLIIYNDDFNTFDWVIQCLMEVCGHEEIQAEQLSIIIHNKGKATAKTGAYDVLKPMKDALSERGLSVVIEKEVNQD
jgi:ATP-dependent Clp protease adaptor protein ClpS